MGGREGGREGKKERGMQINECRSIDNSNVYCIM